MKHLTKQQRKELEAYMYRQYMYGHKFSKGMLHLTGVLILIAFITIL